MGHFIKIRDTYFYSIVAASLDETHLKANLDNLPKVAVIKINTIIDLLGGLADKKFMERIGGLHPIKAEYFETWAYFHVQYHYPRINYMAMVTISKCFKLKERHLSVAGQEKCSENEEILAEIDFGISFIENAISSLT